MKVSLFISLLITFGFVNTGTAQVGRVPVEANSEPSAPTKPAAKPPAPPSSQPSTTPEAPPMPMPEPTPPATPATPVSESAKSQDQRSYEAEADKRIEKLAAEIAELERKSGSLSDDKRLGLRDVLNTAAGNRSVVRTKVKQLKFIPPNQWQTLRPGIEKAFSNLEASIKRARSDYESASATPLK